VIKQNVSRRFFARVWEVYTLVIGREAVGTVRYGRQQQTRDPTQYVLAIGSVLATYMYPCMWLSIWLSNNLDDGHAGCLEWAVCVSGVKKSEFVHCYLWHAIGDIVKSMS
jgi:hypothetical protein